MSRNGRGATVESSLPGRVRVRLPQRERREDVLSEVKSLLESVDGINEVRINPRTGSVLVRHDPEAVQPDQLLDTLRAANVAVHTGEELLGAEEEAVWPTVSQLAQGVVRSFKRFDRTVSRMTGGKIDGKMLLILLLLIVGLTRALTSNGKRMPAPWHALIWYAYSAFMQWHNPARVVHGRAR